MNNSMKKIIFSFAVSLGLLVGCDDHFDFPDTSIKVCDILCTDGDVLHYEDFFGMDSKTAIGVVFYINHDKEVEGEGFAVYLHDLSPAALSDSCGIIQKTSTDLASLDGNSNTYALYSNGGCGSPLANEVFDLWAYGQSAYIPSVGQYRLLYEHRDVINRYLVLCGGDPLSTQADECWYWTSTEVAGQAGEKAWLYSLQSGSIQETPKGQAHKARPIITINR